MFRCSNSTLFARLWTPSPAPIALARGIARTAPTARLLFFALPVPKKKNATNRIQMPRTSSSTFWQSLPERHECDMSAFVRGFRNFRCGGPWLEVKEEPALSEARVQMVALNCPIESERDSL